MAGRFDVSQFVDSQTVAATASPITVKPPTQTKLDKAWPVGDLLYKTLLLRFAGNLLNGGNYTANNQGGILAFLQNLVVRTDLHQELVDNVDGLSLYLMLCAKAKAYVGSLTIPGNATVGQDPAFEASFPIPFFDTELVRPQDTQLDVLRAQPIVRAQFDVASQFGGDTVSLEVENLLLNATVDYDPGPITKMYTGLSNPDGSPQIKTDEPIFQPYYFILPVPLFTSRTKALRIPLPYSDRIYRRIHVWQRASGSNQQATGMLSQLETDVIALKLNGFNITPGLYQKDLASRMESRYGTAPLCAPLGGKGDAAFTPNPWQQSGRGATLILDFENDPTLGNRLSEAVSVVSPNNGTLVLEIDVSAPQNSGDYILIGCECVKPLVGGAQSARPIAGAAPKAPIPAAPSTGA